MSKIQLIYTPETDHFRLGDADMFGYRELGDPLVRNLKKNYQKLKRDIPNLPVGVGIVTCSKETKKYSVKNLQKFKNTEIVESTTPYIPLDILKASIDLKDIDFNDPLSAESAYRILGFTLSHRSLVTDQSLSWEMKEVLLLFPIRPKADMVSKEVQEASEKISKYPIDLKETELLKKIPVILRGEYPTWENLEAVYYHFLERFEANKISREFPLYFVPPRSLIPSLYSVSLVDEIEKSSALKPLQEIIELACKSNNLGSIPADVQELLNSMQKEKFGQTMRARELEELLKKLPEPQTIITDLYIVDHFPQLAEMGFEAREFKLED